MTEITYLEADNAQVALIECEVAYVRSDNPRD